MKHVAPFVRSAHNYDMNTASEETALECKDKSLTQQHLADDSDINTIVKRFNLTGQLPTNVRMPTYGDFEHTYDYHSAMTAIAQARESFDKMPAGIRARFNNDPAQFVDFCSQEANRAEAEKMGLVSPKALQAAASLTATPAPLAPGADAPPGLTAPASKGKTDTK